MSQDVDYQALSTVEASQYRKNTLKHLDQQDYNTPSTIADALDINIHHVSRSLQDLREEGLVELLVSEDTKKGRLYGITENGRDIARVVTDG